MVKATFKQDQYESKLSESIKLMDIHSQRFHDVALECSFQTQKSTLGELRSLNSRTCADNQSIMQSITCSRSEASLQHLNTMNVFKAESENNKMSMENLQNEVGQLKNGQAELRKLLKGNLVAVELRKALEEFHNESGRIALRRNDGLGPKRSSERNRQDAIWCPSRIEDHPAAGKLASI